MKTLNLQVDNALYEHLLAVLKQLPQEKIQIRELAQDETNAPLIATDDAKHLMELVGQLSAFKTIDNPVAWQKQQREEWKK
jgi:hypothetical protein